MGEVGDASPLSKKWGDGVPRVPVPLHPWAGVKNEKSGGVAGGHVECRDYVAGLLVRERRSLDILPVKRKQKAACK